MTDFQQETKKGDPRNNPLRPGNSITITESSSLAVEDDEKIHSAESKRPREGYYSTRRQELYR